MTNSHRYMSFNYAEPTNLTQTSYFSKWNSAFIKRPKMHFGMQIDDVGATKNAAY